MYSLQNIEWKKSGKPEGTESLYYNGENIEVTHNALILGKSGTLDFFTYSNIFNWKKWYKYTGLEDLTLRVTINGQFTVKIYSDDSLILNKNVSSSGGPVDISVSGEYKNAIISFTLESEEGGSFLGGEWISLMENKNYHPVKIALVMCTFNRDEYLYGNLKVLKGCLPENYAVFIVDNGNRIEEESVTAMDPRFKLFHNNNTGGSGGFTRGLVEAIRDDEEWTHVHFMDDDVTIEPESLYRTVSFLSLLKEEYREAFLSGSMLRMDTPWILHENTAEWTGVLIKSRNKGLDLRNRDNILNNESEYYSPVLLFTECYLVNLLQKIT
ncbi:MAG: glycosyltransferase [Spirochaetaceae bacterium]|nr:glycosyltransferase [Spirochaetaceae bacterium]